MINNLFSDEAYSGSNYDLDRKSKESASCFSEQFEKDSTGPTSGASMKSDLEEE